MTDQQSNGHEEKRKVPNGLELPDGYVVKYHHRRLEESDAIHLMNTFTLEGFNAYMTAYENANLLPAHELSEVSPTGGLTTAVILDADGNEVATAEARCSVFDNFVYRTARERSLGRAISAMKRQAESVPA